MASGMPAGALGALTSKSGGLIAGDERKNNKPKLIRNFKYKHKKRQVRDEKSKKQSMSSCDLQTLIKSRWRRKRPPRRPVVLVYLSTVCLLFLVVVAILPASLAFCPFKCHCNDAQLSANCTQVSSLTFVPMTLNPLLKSLTLSQLPMSELANSLSIYNKLEYLNLNSNQLRQIKYENFNLRSAPSKLTLTVPAGGADQTDRPHAGDTGELLDGQHSLVELHLSDNKIELLGELNYEEDQQQQQQHATRIHLKASQLERLAPFLWLSKLRLLDLSANRLQRLNKHTFLGLSSLNKLDLSRNQLAHLDKLALVGLVQLEELNLSHNHLASQLPSLSLALCRMPAGNLLKLNLNNNNNQARHSIGHKHTNLFLPNQMFLCAPRLVDLQLAFVGLNYVQVNAFDNLQQVARLNLSGNPLESVPSEAFDYQPAGAGVGEEQPTLPGQTTSNLASTLTELDLSETLIEFVNSNSFGSLKKLERLDLNAMPRLVSFDLAALISKGTDNANLRHLSLRYNRHLQAFYSSLWFKREQQPEKVHFRSLEKIDLFGASELHDLPVEQMLSTTSRQLEVDLSFAVSLNCSSCSLSWLVKQIQPNYPQQQQPPANVGWSPIAFDPYQAYFRPWGSPVPSVDVAGRIWLASSTQVSTLGCSWPVQAPLVQVLSSQQGSHLLDHCSSQLDSLGQKNPSWPVEPNNKSISAPIREGSHDNLSPLVLSGALAGIVLLVLIFVIVRLLFVYCVGDTKNARSCKTRQANLLMWPPSFSTTSTTSSPLGSPGSSCVLSATSSGSPLGQVTYFNESRCVKGSPLGPNVGGSGQHQCNSSMLAQKQPLAVENHHSQMFEATTTTNNYKSMLAEQFASRGNLFSRFVGHLRILEPAKGREIIRATAKREERQLAGQPGSGLGVPVAGATQDYWWLSSQRAGQSNHGREFVAGPKTTRISSGQATQFISKVNLGAAGGCELAATATATTERKLRNNRQSLIDCRDARYDDGHRLGQLQANVNEETTTATSTTCKSTPTATASCRLANHLEMPVGGQCKVGQSAGAYGTHGDHLNVYVTLDGPIRGGQANVAKQTTTTTTTTTTTSRDYVDTERGLQNDRFGIICVANNLNGDEDVGDFTDHQDDHHRPDIYSYRAGGQDAGLSGAAQGEDEYDIIGANTEHDVTDVHAVPFGQQEGQLVESARLSKYDANHNNNNNDDADDDRHAAQKADNYVINGTTTRLPGGRTATVGVPGGALTSFAVQTAPPAATKPQRKEEQQLQQRQQQLATNENSIMICQQEGRRPLPRRPTASGQQGSPIRLMNGGDVCGPTTTTGEHNYIEFCDGSGGETTTTTARQAPPSRPQATGARSAATAAAASNGQIYSNQFYYYCRPN